MFDSLAKKAGAMRPHMPAKKWTAVALTGSSMRSLRQSLAPMV